MHYIDEEPCEVSSGLEFMLTLFKGMNDKVDQMFKYLENEPKGSIDFILEYAKQCVGFKVKPEHVPKYLPFFHTWWFKNAFFKCILIYGKCISLIAF